MYNIVDKTNGTPDDSTDDPTDTELDTLIDDGLTLTTSITDHDAGVLENRDKAIVRALITMVQLGWFGPYAEDNYPRRQWDDLNMYNARAHIDTLTLAPVIDVDGVSLVKYTVDSAHMGDADDNPATDPTVVKDGRYRLEAYGAWLSDSYFGIHTYTAVTNEGTDLIDPTRSSTHARHFAGGNPASLTGLGESATWTGAMVGVDTLSTADDPRVQGNAMLNAHIVSDSLADAASIGDVGGVAVMDVMFDNITGADGMPARVEMLSWSNLELTDRSMAPRLPVSSSPTARSRAGCSTTATRSSASSTTWT